MIHQVLIVAWWFLATANTPITYSTSSSTVSPVATAFGPYPNEQMCIEAAHKASPDDDRFWTDEQKTEMQNFNKLNSTYNKCSSDVAHLLGSLAKANPKVGLYKYESKYFKIISIDNINIIAHTSHNSDATWFYYTTDNITNDIKENAPWFFTPDQCFNDYCAIPQIVNNSQPWYKECKAPEIPKWYSGINNYTIDQPCVKIKGWYINK